MVREIVEKQTKQGYPNPEEEKMDLQRMEEEAQELTMLAEMLVQKVRSGYRASRRSTLLKMGPPLVADETGSDIVIMVEDTSLPLTEGSGPDITATAGEGVGTPVAQKVNKMAWYYNATKHQVFIMHVRLH